MVRLWFHAVWAFILIVLVAYVLYVCLCAVPRRIPLRCVAAFVLYTRARVTRIHAPCLFLFFFTGNGNITVCFGAVGYI